MKEIIDQILASEQEADTYIKNAHATAEDIVQQAALQAQRLIEESRIQAFAASKNMIQQAHAKAQEQYEKKLRDINEQTTHICREKESLINDTAASIITWLTN